MKTAIIAGATGLTGSHLRSLLLNNPYYEKVKILVRKPIEIFHEKLEQVFFDYKHPDKELVKGDHVYCCLGTTIKEAGSKEAFREVDFDYPLQLAEWSLTNGASRYALMSSMGADKNSFFFYNRVKGEVEEQLKKFPFESIFILRPSVILGIRDEFRFKEEMGKLLLKPLQPLFPKNLKSIHASQIAHCMMDQMTREEKGTHTILSGEMQKYPVHKNKSV